MLVTLAASLSQYLLLYSNSISTLSSNIFHKGIFAIFSNIPCSDKTQTQATHRNSAINNRPAVCKKKFWFIIYSDLYNTLAVKLKNWYQLVIFFKFWKCCGGKSFPDHRSWRHHWWPSSQESRPSGGKVTLQLGFEPWSRQKLHRSTPTVL